MSRPAAQPISPQASAATACLANVLTWLAVLVGVSDTLPAAPPAAWEVMRIYIPDEREMIEKLVPGDYSPRRIEVIEQQLAVEAERRRTQSLETSGLEEAVYVAQVEGDRLVSELSSWRLRGVSNEQIVPIGNVSVALNQAPDIANHKQLVNYQSANSQGAVHVRFDRGEPVYWFGFVAKATRDSQPRTFQLELPEAPFAQMFIATAGGATLKSSQVVVERVQDLVAELPADWQAASRLIPSTASSTQWWRVHCSATRQFDLIVEEDTASARIAQRQLLRSADADYHLTSESVQIMARFELAHDPLRGPIQLRLDSRLRIRDLLINDRDAQWHIAARGTADSNLIELESISGEDDLLTIVVRALAPISLGESLRLPFLAVDKSFAIRGVSHVHASPDLLIHDLNVAGSRLATQTSQPRDDASASAAGPPWTVDWIGVEPSIDIGVARVAQRWNADTFTRFTMQAEWLAASSRARVHSRSTDSNELRFRVGKGWFVDDVRVVSTSEASLRVTLYEPAESENALIIATWTGNPVDMDFDLEVFAHSPKPTDQARISLGAQSLLTLPGANQSDNYAIEPSGRFRVQANATLLRLQLQPRDLPAWQQELLLQGSNRWLFTGSRGLVPSINLIAYSGTFVANVTTMVTNTQDLPSVSSIIKCQPISGAVDRLHVLIPEGMDSEKLQWVFQLAGDDSTSAPLKVVEGGRLGSGDVVLELELPEPAYDPFFVRCQLETQAVGAAHFEVPIFAVPRAAGGGSIVIFPKRFAPPLGKPHMELLPSDLCCGEDGSLQPLGTQSDDRATDYISARLDATDSQILSFPTGPRDIALDGWATREELEHRLYDNGQRVHEARWSVQTVDAATLALRLPSGWSPISLTLDDQRVELPKPGDGNIQIELPSGGQSVIALRCTSQAQPRQWLQRVQLARPAISLPVLMREEAIHIPPSRVAVQSLGVMRKASTLMDRLRPSRLWRWLNPSRIDEHVTSPVGQGWSVMHLTDDASTQHALSHGPADLANQADTLRGLWIADRTAVAALALTFLVACTAVLRGISMIATIAWWKTMLAAVVLTLLAPAALLPLAQLLLLGIACATLVRLAVPILGFRNAGPSSPRTGSRAVSSVGIRGACFFLCLLGVSAPAWGQAYDETSRSANPLDVADQGPVYGLLIPINQQGKFSGPYVYAPTELLRLLSNPENDSSMQQQPQILSAEYTFRIRRGVLLGPSRVQELTVDLIAQFVEGNTELVFPLDASEVRLQGGQVDGQEIADGRLFQDFARNAIVYRAAMAGQVALQLRFEELIPSEESGRRVVKLSVPPLSNAAVRIQSDSQLDFQVESIGPVQRSMSGLLARIGPLPYIELSWPVAPDRSFGQVGTAPNSAETWIHAAGDGVLAACQLTVNGGMQLGEELRIQCDAGWEPIGRFWGDGELVDSSVVSLGNQVIYSVRLRERFGATDSSRVFRVLMAPRDPQRSTTLKMPFLAIPGDQPPPRILTWSSDNAALWKPENIDYWPPLPESSQISWGELFLSAAPRSRYRVDAGSTSNTLRKTTNPAPPAANESTIVHLGLTSLRLEYKVQSRTAGLQAGSLQLRIPKGARVEKISVNGVALEAIDYSLGQRALDDLVLVEREPAALAVQSVEVDLQMNLRLGVAASLPRVLLEHFGIRSSVYQVLRGAGAECEILGDAIALGPTAISPTVLLEKMESAVGQAELADQFRDSVDLPIEYRLRRQRAPRELFSMIRVDRSEAGWKAEFTAHWSDVEQPIDVVCLQVPASLRDSIEMGQVLRRFVPTGDSSRLSLCLLPLPPVDDRVGISLQFPLPTAPTSQSLGIPDIDVLAADYAGRVVALPKRIAGQTVRWSKLGNRKGDDWKENVSQQLWSQYDFFELSDGPTQAVWRADDNSQRRAELLYREINITSLENELVSGLGEYWIQPNGELSLTFHLADNCRVLGAQCAGRPVAWRAADPGHITLLLQPNYLPLQVRLLLQWDLAFEHGAPLRFPDLEEVDQEGKRTLVRSFLADTHVVQATDSVAASDALATRWSRVVADSLTSLSSLSNAEMEEWLASWHPDTFGLDMQSVIPEAIPLSSPDTVESGTTQTVAAFWESACNQLGAGETVIDPAFRPFSHPSRLAGLLRNRDLGRSSTREFTIATDRIELVSGSARTTISSRIVAAVLLVLASLLGVYVARRWGSLYTAQLIHNPWLFWVQLAAAGFIILPVYWPSVVLLLLGAYLLLLHYLDYRKRRRSLARF